MIIKKISMIGILILISIALMSIIGCAEEAVTPPTTPAEFKTYSKYGFSFDYPKRFSVTEMGLMESEASDSSGLVQVGIENDEVQIFQTTWLAIIQSTWEVAGDLQGVLEDSFAGIETEEGVVGVAAGELVETTKAGHQLLYQYYTVTFTEGDKMYGIVAVFYCDESQKCFQLMTINNTISAKQDILEDFRNYLASFVCH